MSNQSAIRPAPATDPLYVRLGMITRELHDMLSTLRAGLGAGEGGMRAALQRQQPDHARTALLTGRLLCQLERTEQELLRLLADSGRKGSLARQGSAARRCLDELLAPAPACAMARLPDTPAIRQPHQE